MGHWYVAKTKARQEAQLAMILERRGLQTYLPLMPAGRRPADRARQEPLFPGYLFSYLDVRTSQWLEARSAPGVAYFLGSEGVPTPVPEELVEEIRWRIRKHDYAPRRPAFRIGDRVRITDGPMQGLEAVFDGTLSATGRSRVLVSMVSRLVPVSLDAEQLSAIR